MIQDLPIKVAQLETLNGLGEILLKSFSIELLTGESTSSYDAANLYWMWKRASSYAMVWPSDKTGRWIGFIQGVLAVGGYLDVSEERDRTRPIFHKAYEAMGFDKPETADIHTTSEHMTGLDSDAWPDLTQ